MRRLKAEKISIDPELRAQALRVIEAYKTKRVDAKNPFDEIAPAAMNALSDLIDRDDRGELSVSMQRSLVRLMKKAVAKYRV